MRIITDIFEWSSIHLPKWNSISISGYHIREAGSTAVQEIAFTLSNGKAYVKAAIEKGLDINIFGKGEELRDHIYISDLSKLIYQCLINNYIGVINAVTGTAVSFYEIAKFFKNKNNKIKIINIPRTQKMPHNGFRLFDNKKIKKLFYNFHFTKIKVGLNRIS
jgi:nucleoside-diphosphate-sugar epimerase